MYVTLIPAYNRDYTNAAAVKKDWQENKDFIIACAFHPDDGRYTSIEDARKSNKGERYSIRYAKLTKTVNVNY